MATPSSALHPQHRRLAELEAVISQAERLRDRYRLDLAGTTGGGKGPRRAGAMLRMAEERLELLYRSRQALLGGDGEAG